MTTDLQTEILATALRTWPARWRHPATMLAVAEDRGVPRSGDLVHAFLTDLSRLDTPVTACRRLIGRGEFETVRQLLSEESIEPADRAELTSDLDRAVMRGITDLRYELASLRRRAELTGRPISLDAARLEEQARRSYPPVAAELTDAERRVGEVENNVRRELWAAATATAAAGPGGAATLWLAEIRSSLATGDLATSRRLVAAGPGRPEPHPDNSDPVSGLDEQGTALAIALSAMADRLTEHTAFDFVRALGRLIGAAAPLYQVRGASDGVLVSLRCQWPGLPRWLAVPDGEGLDLWVAPGNRPPSAPSAPAAWFVTDADVSAPSLPGLARITREQLLDLALTETGSDARLYGLLRLICSQLPVPEVVKDQGSALSLSEVAELLDLLGLPAPPDMTAVLHYESGGRPRLIVDLLTEALCQPGGRAGMGPAALQEARRTSWPRTFEALLEPYRDDHAGLLLLVAVMFHADQEAGFTVDELREGIAAVAASREAAAQLRSLPGLPAAAERLVRDGFFQRRSETGYALSDDGVRHLLPQGPDGRGVRRHAEDAAVAAHRRHLADTAEQRAEIGAQVIRVISHMVSGTMSAIKTELTLIERTQDPELQAAVARVRRYADTGQNLDEQFERAMRPLEPCALRPLLTGMGETQSWRSHGVVRVVLNCPPNFHVMANRWLLGQAFANMLDNGRLAIQETGADLGLMRVTVTSDGSHCTVDIADSGGGLPQERRRLLEARQQVPSTRGRGIGLLHSRGWFESYGGDLEIPAGNSDLGGAWFRVRLPLCESFSD
ncbi:sensor histidine kinase [Streptomyces sp. NPDC056367]|uniref:sensor histidine kinase n=1 Tax=Streptomyces sp. NPDC056367 TaxID=3345797 RepID=UPI0035E3BBCB